MYVPELKWRAPGNYPSFTVVCDMLQAVIRANPALAQKHHWPLDRPSLEDWVDSYNATLCAAMGWDDYILPGEGGSAIPKSEPPRQNLASLRAAAGLVKDLIAGAQSLTEWIDSDVPPVPRDCATQRAEICVDCPKNSPEDLTKWFTVPAAELIKRQIEKAQSRALSTMHDEHLNLCTACHCPLKLKCHVPIAWITKRLTPEQFVKLKEAPACWILRESGK